MSALKDAYRKLYREANTPNGYKFHKTTHYFSELSHFTGMKGEKYGTNNCSPRLLIVGRAVNGWYDMDTSSAEAYSDVAISRFENWHFDWVQLDIEKQTLRNEKRDSKTNKYYWLNSSPFWRTAEAMWRNLPGTPSVEDCETENWTDYIAWTNLYKVAPLESENPTTTMSKNQLAACKEILKIEIETFNPTHIVFVTGYYGWFEDFKDLFDADFSEVHENKYRNSEKNGYFVETHGTTFKGVKIIVACRPEGRDEQAWVNDVKSKF